MNKVEKMLLETEDSSVLFKEFMSITKTKAYRDKDIVICIFEGDEDFSFYNIKVKSILNTGTEKIVSNGIDKSYDLLKDINDSSYYSQHSFISFLDSDFYLNCSHILMSDNRVFRLNKYSIENFYITNQFFINVLDGLTNLVKNRTEEDGELEENSDYLIVNRYIVSEKNRLLMLIRDYMICLRAIVTNDLNIKFRNSDDVIDKIVKNYNQKIINDGVIDTSFFNKLFPISIDQYSKEKIESRVSENDDYFDRYGIIKSYRGKELLYISYKVLNSLKNKFCQSDIELSEDFKFSKQLSLNDFINDFSIYTEEPEGLRLFLEGFKSRYLKY